jgi:hypothetical protein
MENFQYILNVALAAPARVGDDEADGADPAARELAARLRKVRLRIAQSM